MPQGSRDKARIALLIMVAVLAITLAMLEALADNPPAPAALSTIAGASLATDGTVPAADVSSLQNLGRRWLK